MSTSETFSTDTGGLPDASLPSVVELREGDHFNLRITPVRKNIEGAAVRMLAYNSSIPGPTLRVAQGSEITVEVVNDGDVETTVHWHGLRLENQYDGVPEETQSPIPVGGSFTYKVRFPDPGLYWYHPHIREDFAQEMGLYAPIVVEPTDPSYWPPADRELTVTLDDVLIEDGRMAPFRRSGPSFTAMGRFGNVMLINGETRFSAGAAAGEVLRLYLLDTANTRIFNVGVRGARMKLVGGDSGRYERETFVDEVLLSPSERMVLDILFEKPGEASFQHRTPEKTYELGAFSVEEGKATSSVSSFAVLRSDPELNSLRESIGDDLERSPDKVLAFVASMPLLYGDEEGHASAYVCPMHPEVTSTEPGACPKCGMKLIPAQPEAKSYVCPMHPDVSAAEPGTCPRCGMRLMPSDAPSVPSPGMHESHEHGGHHGDDGLEWEDLMPEINRATDPSNMIWKIIDRETGAENAAISWRFAVGDKVKMRLVNEMESDHPMHHPFHIHGAGRFLILSRNGRPESNLVWKDTVLLRAGETVDILLYVTNPGLWMAHCHIAEHTESGMMFSFEVTP